jgi:hypothetical protein
VVVRPDVVALVVLVVEPQPLAVADTLASVVLDAVEPQQLVAEAPVAAALQLAVAVEAQVVVAQQRLVAALGAPALEQQPTWHQSISIRCLFASNFPLQICSQPVRVSNDLGATTIHCFATPRCHEPRRVLLWLRQILREQLVGLTSVDAHALPNDPQPKRSGLHLFSSYHPPKSDWSDF